MRFGTYEKIHKSIAAVNALCYPKIKENVFFLEQVTEKNLVKVMQEIRDAYDHLHHIYMHPDPFTSDAQENINSEFEKYKGHLQRLAIETVRKVAEYYFSVIKSSLQRDGKPGDWEVVKVQLAKKVKDARDRETCGDFAIRYAAWQGILDYTDDILKRYGMLQGA